MKKSQSLAIAAIAAAVSAAFGSPAYGAQQIIGAGASAINNTLKQVIVNDYCGGTATVYDNGTASGESTTTNAVGNGTVYRISCAAISTVKFNSGVDISYDTTGGSWKGLLAGVAPSSVFEQIAQSADNPYPPLTIDESSSTCSTPVTGQGLSGNVTLVYGCGTIAIPAGATVNFGFTDVEAKMFENTGYNEPLQNGTWAVGQSPASLFLNGTLPISGLTSEPFPTSFSEASGFGQGFPAFGVVFGIAASPALYAAMQQDQVNQGMLPSSCVSPTAVAWSGGGNSCVPMITRAQYRSIVDLNSSTGGNGLSINANGLFWSSAYNTANAQLELARRDQGSGTQASSNAFFLDVGCGLNGASYTTDAPALPSDTGTATEAINIQYEATTTNVLNEINTPSQGIAYVIGVVSAENDKNSKFSTGSPATLTGAGFLRLDGQYPLNTNAASGLYDYMSTENFHCSASNATGTDGLTLCKDLANKNGSLNVPVSDTLLGYTGTGIVELSTSSYSNRNNQCGRQLHL